MMFRKSTVGKVVRLDWLGNLANYKDYNVLFFMLCARSQSFVLGVMLHQSIGR